MTKDQIIEAIQNKTGYTRGDFLYFCAQRYGKHPSKLNAETLAAWLKELSQ